MKRRLRKKRNDTVLEMTPLIDMVFILLIFFIVTTSFIKEAGVTVEKPQSSHSQSLQQGFIAIAITRSGTIHNNGRRISADDTSSIQQSMDQGGVSRVVIQADKNAPLGIVLQVQDTCLLAGAESVTIGALLP